LQNLVAIVFLLAVTTAKAQVYKCTGTDGKTAFSDQPCATGQKAAVIKPQTSSDAVAKGSASASTSDYKTRPEYPECLRLRNKLADFFSNSQYKKNPSNKGEMTVGEFMGGDKVLAEVRKDMARYKEICGVVDKEGAREEEKKQALKDKPLRDAEVANRCQFLRKDLQELRDMVAAIAQSTDRQSTEEAKERKQFLEDAKKRTPALEQEAAKYCAQK
jgi:hypothetical protein